MRRTPFVALLVGVVLLSAGLLGRPGRRPGAVSRTGRCSATPRRWPRPSPLTSSVRAVSISCWRKARPSGRRAGGGRQRGGKPSPGVPGAALPGGDRRGMPDQRSGSRARPGDRGRRRPVAELSTAEAQNPFFAPTLALAPGQVYQAAPYVSVDTGTWVISNSTWIRQADGTQLIVHFEVALASFRQYLTTSTGSRHVAVVDRTSGRMVLADDADLPPTTAEAQFPHFLGAAALRSSGTRPATIRSTGSALRGWWRRANGSQRQRLGDPRAVHRPGQLHITVGGGRRRSTGLRSDPVVPDHRAAPAGHVADGGTTRPPHGDGEPEGTRRGVGRCGDRCGSPWRGSGRGPDARPGRVQADQRHTRPRQGRPRAPGDRATPAREHIRVRHRSPVGRRRVRGRLATAAGGR